MTAHADTPGQSTGGGETQTPVVAVAGLSAGDQFVALSSGGSTDSIQTLVANPAPAGGDPPPPGAFGLSWRHARG